MSDVVSDLIKNGENQFVEFKTSFTKATIETIVAFANTRGGKILVGVSDSGKIKGVTLSSETIQEWTNLIKQNSSPAIVPDFEVLSVNNKSVVVIEVKEFPVKPISTRGKYFKRNNNSNHQMSLTEIANQYLQTFNLSWDAYEYPDATLNDLDINKIEIFIDKVNKSDRFSLDLSPMIALEKLKLIKNSNPTGAALLLFAKNPLPYNVHIGRFKTASTIIDDRMIKGTLYDVIEETMKFIISHIKVAFEFDGSIERKEIFEYPLQAIKEAVLNAIIHRDYTIPSDIQIKIFDKSVEIFNPGGLYGDLTVENLNTDNYHSHIRNVLISEALYLTKDIEKYGTGFIRIREQVLEYETMQFLYKEEGNGFSVVFEYEKQKDSLDTTPKKDGTTPKKDGTTPKKDGTTPKKDDTTPKKNNDAYKVLEIISRDNRVTKESIALKLGITVNTVKYHLKTLKKNKLLIWEGAPRSGNWKILK